MEDIYTVEDYLSDVIHGSDVINKAEKLIRLKSVLNETSKRELWKDSIKVKYAVTNRKETVVVFLFFNCIMLIRVIT